MTFDEMIEELRKEDPVFWAEVDKGVEVFLARKDCYGKCGRCVTANVTAVYGKTTVVALNG